MSDLEKQLEELTKQVQRLSDRVSRIEGTFPQGPFGPSFPYQPVAPVVDYGQCSKCGIKLDQVMGYVCSQVFCPTGLGGTRCEKV